MKTISIDEVTPNMDVISVGDIAMYLNIFHHHIVDVLLEAYTDFTDFDIIAEIIDELNLDIVCVAEPIPQGKLIYGYINNEKKVVA